MMDSVADITIWIAVWAGIVSFVSPCTLPLYPAYLSYITGISASQLQEKKQTTQIRWKVISHTVFFLIGISSIYLALAYTASFFGEFFVNYRILIQQIAGVVIVIMGLFLVGIFKMEWLMRERRLFNITKKPAGYIGTTFIGMGFAAGWAPCMGPILTFILALAATNPAQGMTYMSAYLLGFALPFLVLSFFISSTRWIVKYSQTIMKIGGVFMIILGVLLYTDMFFMINTYLNELIQGTWFERIG